jgi:hypothetical protein
VAEHARLRLLDQGVHAAAGQIFLIVEVLEDGRRFQAAAHRHPVALAQPRIAVDGEQGPAAHRPRLVVLAQGDAFGGDQHPQPGVAVLRRSQHQAGDGGAHGALGAAVVEGQVARG